MRYINDNALKISRPADVFNRFYFIVYLFSFTIFGTYGVQITDLRVPNGVRNGTGNAAVLDCDYTLKPDEINLNAGLVIKWYFDNNPVPVYQWIIGKKPQGLGILKGRLNLNHRVSDHNYTMHRALYIVNPTTELSGEYKCFASTFEDEDFMSKKMVVYVPEKKLEMTSHMARDTGTVNVTCKAHGVYPEPKMSLYMGPDRKTQSGVLDGVAVETVFTRSGVYDIIATKVLYDEDLISPTIFGCELRIPEANYFARKSIVYYPGIGNIDSGSRKNSVVTFWLWLSLIVPMFTLSMTTQDRI